MTVPNSTPIRTRMAPSPTGEMHVGSFATLLKNYAYAKKFGGQFVLRIEDTDKTREVEGGITAIMEIIKSYGLDWDEGPSKNGPYGPYIQSERLDIYRQYASTLLDAGKAYRCFCSKERLEKLRQQQQSNHQPPGYDRTCLSLSKAQIDEKLQSQEPCVIRLKVPDNQEIEFTDVLRGKIKFMSNEVDDQVLIKSDGFPTYHLAVVVDDYLMKISHIIRGEEWISSAPKHVLLYQAFGWPIPVFCHVPVFLNPDGKGKMSKRKGTVSARSFLERGYLKEAMLNFLMILGWTPKDQRDIVSLDEYIKEFDIADLHPNNVVFDLKKLDWLNGQYIRKLSLDELIIKLVPFVPLDLPKQLLPKVLPLIKDRLVRLSDLELLTDFFYKEIVVDTALLTKKNDKSLVTIQLKLTFDTLNTIENWTTQDLELAIRSLQENNAWHLGNYFMMLRIALTGKIATPPLFETIEVLGKQMVINRLNNALELSTKNS